MPFVAPVGYIYIALEIIRFINRKSGIIPENKVKLCPILSKIC